MNDLLGVPLLPGSVPARWLDGGAMLALALIGAGLLHRLVFLLWRRAAARTRTPADDILVRRLDRPTFWAALAFAFVMAAPGLPFDAEGRLVWHRIAGMAAPGLTGWIAVALLKAFNDLVLARTDITGTDNLRARRRRTRAGILHNIAVFATVLITLCLVLLSLPAVRNIGVTLAASAGIAGLAVGAAAQPALKNLIAGIQMAFTEPIRIDDVVIVAGEWGRIEDIRLTYVVVKLWDERRLIVPVARFLEDTFENWTRDTSALTGSAFLHLDPTADVPRLRAELTRLLAGDPLWDGRVNALQVTDTAADAIEIRLLMSATDAARTFDLRCRAREAMLAFIRRDMPDALPRRRVGLEPARSQADDQRIQSVSGRQRGPPEAVEG